MERTNLAPEVEQRRRVESALSRSEEWLRATVESAPTAIVMIDRAGRIVLVNAETEKLFGYSRAELYGQSVELLVPLRFRPEHPDHRATFFAAPVARRMGVGRDLFGLRKNGSEFPVEIGLNPIDTDQGSFVLSAIVDITERKQHEDALRQSEERIRLIVDSSPDAIVAIDDQGRITGWNPQAEKLFGWTRPEALGHELATLIIPDQFRAAHRAGLQKFLATGVGPALNQRLELVALRRGNHEFPVEITISPIRLGDHYEFSAFVRDIRPRKAAEERFRVAVESAPNAMIMVDQQGTIVLVNSQTEQLFGYDRGELVGRRVELLVPERFRQQHPEYRHEFFANLEVRAMGAGRDLFGRRKDGSEFPVEIGLNPLETEQGLFVLSAIIDITERKRAEEALRQAHDELELRVAERTAESEARANLLDRANAELARSNVELQQFAFVASHDLQEPLRKIQAFGGLLQAKYQHVVDQQGRDYLQRMQNAATRMRALIDDLLGYSRISNRNQPFEDVDLAQVAESVVSDLEGRIQQTGGQVEIGTLDRIEADPLQMRQLLQNLIGNGLKYRRPDVPPLVKVESAIVSNADGSSLAGVGSELVCQLSVADNGIGFEEKYLPRLFAPFQRLHSRSEYEGTGMGLAVCRKIAERHHGAITARSMPNQGSTFIVTLPIKQPQEEAIP